MQAAARPNVMAGVALAGASFIAVTPIASPPDLPRLTNAAVRLTSGEDLLGSLTSFDPLASLGGLFDSGSPSNIPYNLFADLVNIPYSESLALQEYAYALGPAGSVINGHQLVAAVALRRDQPLGRQEQVKPVAHSSPSPRVRASAAARSDADPA